MCKIKQIVPNCTINYRRDACMWILISISLMSCFKTLQAAQIQTAAMAAGQPRGATKGLQNNSGDNTTNTTTTTIKSTTSTTIVNEALTAASAAAAATETEIETETEADAAATAAADVDDDPQQQQQHQLLPPSPSDSLGRGAIEAKTSATTTTSNKYEIRAVAGEPNYKSVNLTWEVEFVPLANDDSNTNEAISGVAVTNELEPMPLSAFQIFYCELQTFGPQRCRVKLVNGTTTTTTMTTANAATKSPEHDDEPMPASSTTTAHDVRHFSALIDNLRMATRYTFHIRPQPPPQQLQPGRRASGRHIGGARAEFTNEIESELKRGEFNGGQTIVIPTKGFTAHATQCLPHASEIEVETGPYFAGRIVVDGGNCGIKGDPEDAADKYTMRIDHKLCGSMVKPETNTVETFITVQENLGIFTHSTRRFVVVCSYQSGMQTVRASFTVPGKNGLAAPIEEQNDPFEPDEPDELRMGRDMRRMRYVDKTHLVLKDSALNLNEVATAHEQVRQPLAEARQAAEESAEVQELPPEDTASRSTGANLHDSAELSAPDMQVLHTKYAKLVLNQAEQRDNNNNNDNDDNNNDIDNWYEAKSMPVAAQHSNDDAVYIATLRYITANLGSLLVTVSISVIIISLCIIVAQRHIQRVQRLRMKSSLSSASSSSSSSTSSCYSASSSLPSSCLSKAPTHLPRKTLPRALQQQAHYQCSL